MGFQLSNDEKNSSGSQDTAVSDSPVKAPLSFQNADADDNYEDLEDSVYIANQYQRPVDTTVTPDIGAGTYLSQRTTFSPVLMYIGAALQILGSIIFIYQLNQDNLTIEAVIYSSSIASVLTSIGLILLIVDSILMNTKKCGGPSLIAWALLFPYVYYFKRCKANGDSSLIAVAILVILIALYAFTFQSLQQVMFLFYNM